MLARRRDVRHGRRLLFGAGPDLLRGRGVHLGGAGERLDLGGERLRFLALRVRGVHDAVDGFARTDDLAVDLRERLSGGADDRLAGRDAIAGNEDLLLGAHGAGTDLERQLADLIERLGALARQLADLVGHHGEASAVLAGTRRLDGGVEGEQIGLTRDRADRVGDLADALRLLAELHDRRYRGA